MKSLDVCDSTQNDDDKESVKKIEGQENRENGGEGIVCESVNGGDDDKESDISVILEPRENGSRERSKTRVENEVSERDADRNGGLSGETDETPTSTDGGRLIDLSEDELNGSETEGRKECLDSCQGVSDPVSCSKDPEVNVGSEKSSVDDSKQSQDMKDEPMDVDSVSAMDEPYKDNKRIKSVIETNSMGSFKDEENSSDNTVVDKDGQDDRGFDMDEDTILDSDCDKENEKNDEDNEFSKRDKDDSRVSLVEDMSSECEIRVGECQTISGSEKDFLWSENNESKKSQEPEGNSVSRALDKSVKIHRSSIEKTGEKRGDKCSGEDEVVVEMGKENGKGVKSNRSKPGVGKTSERSLDDSYSNKTDCGSESGKHSKTSPQMESASTRKRKKSNEDESLAESKKKKLGCSSNGARKLSSGGESGNGSSPSKIPSSVDTARTSSAAGQCESEGSKKRALIGDTNSKKSKTSGEEVERLNTQETIESTFLTNLRGTLKNLTRSDLEELIVQKLCEVITERSTIGELRRKAQALEEDQERWRNKVQSLTKQMKEMEMVMKKYISEVQKQVKENGSQMITPIKVTRSVGLQVSFYSNSSKHLKSNATPNTSSTAQSTNPNGNVKNAKASPVKLLLPHFTSVPSPRNKSSPSPQKSSVQAPKTPPSQGKKTVTTRSDSGSLPPKGSAPSLTNANRIIQNPLSGPGIKINYKPPSAVQLPQQNGSKVIDLTEDDDTKPGSVVNKSQSPIRVVNQLSQQPQFQTSSRLAYYVPKTTASGTGTSSSGQSRQVLIATPTVQNRPICPMPPLLFKGGSVGPGPQPPPQNNSRVILPKVLRHPAPLPQPPSTPVTRKNMKLTPPRPALKISKVQTGIVLSWNMTLGPEHAPIASYQLYAYQESNSPPTTSLWKKVGDVKALPLPMACTLTQFMSGHKYHFAVRAVDHHCRLGPFSFPGTIVLVK